MVNHLDSDAITINPVHDAIALKDDFPHVRLTKFGHYPTGLRERAQSLSTLKYTVCK